MDSIYNIYMSAAMLTVTLVAVIHAPWFALLIACAYAAIAIKLG